MSATAGELDALLELQRSSALAAGPPDAALRRDRLERLKRALLSRQQDVVDAISHDFGHRAELESRLFETGSVVAGIDYLSRRLERWMQPSRRRVALRFRPASARVEYQPLGVIGVISPWNYPVALALNPVATAIAAGNRAMLKPSEHTPATSRLLHELINAAFSPSEVAVVEGDAAVARRFASMPFDHLVFTGSTTIGRAVMESAARRLVPVTLELGGKSPAVLLPAARIGIASRRIAFGKLANGGQTCIAPDYALVPEAGLDAFVAAFSAAARSMYPQFPTNRDLTAIVSDSHRERLESMIADAVRQGAEAHFPLGRDPSEIHPRIMPPAVLTGVSDAMTVMQQEIFGPLLPVVGYRSLDEAIERINARPRPLALYAFGPDGADRRKLLGATTSGTVAINDTVLQYAQDDLPFGGVGPSGTGRYHGREGFETFSNVRPVFEQSRLTMAGLARPPFGRAARLITSWTNR